MLGSSMWGNILANRKQAAIVAAIVVVAAGGTYWLTRDRHDTKVEVSSQAKRSQRFAPTDAQWATLTVEPVEKRVFRSEHVTEGKVSVDEDRSTPIFSPYAGRVAKLLVRPGDNVERGQPLFSVEAADMVQAQNDFITASTALNKARSQLNLAQIIDKRQRDLYEGKAVALKEVQNARALLDTAENDVRSGEVALEAARGRLRLLGKTDQEISDFQQKGTIDPATPIVAPIGGTIVQRKVGPGQYIGTGASDPVFVIGDLSTVWLTAYVRETEAPKIRVGQPVKFTVLSYPDRPFTANVSYVAAALDPATRRLLVRATVQNTEGLLKLEMFANVTLLTGEDDACVGVPRDAVLYEGEQARVWVVKEDRSIELRPIKTGLVNGKTIQVLDGLKAGEKVITKGSLFIDRAAASS
jgi:cobalt-zinc-cadmium efflux system membrane fusion protein